MLTLISDKKQSLKTFTENNYAQASFFWTQLLRAREIKVNGERVSKDCTIEKGDKVEYYLTKKQEEKEAFHWIYRDDNILIIDKESGVNSEAVYAALLRIHPCYFIHRLDRNTKGLLVFALTKQAEDSLLLAFRQRTIEKKYYALCLGHLKDKNKVLTAYLKKNEEKSIVKIFPVGDKSEKIITEYKVLSETEDGTSKVEIILHTGKTHQIRAHFAYIGHPIIGDMKYGNAEENKRRNLSRQCLIAKSMRFTFQEKDALAYLNGRSFYSEFDFM